MTWWTWALLGLGLFGAEMLTPGGFYFLFFGVGAIATAGLVWLGVGGPAWFEWALFTAISVACLVPLRSRFVRWASADPRIVDSLVGEEVLLLDDLGQGGVGKGELRGTTWNVRTAGGAVTLRRGERVRVARVDGLTLWVEV